MSATEFNVPNQKIKGVLSFTHDLIEQVIGEGDTVFDCTMGNGHDTLFLAKHVGAAGQVFAYDVQPAALQTTKTRLEQAGCLDQVHLLLKGHETLQDELSRLSVPVAAAMFNLGYLPGSDKTVVTRASSTLKALHQLRKHLRTHGLITLVVYSGHSEGKRERDALLDELSTWDQRQYQILKYEFINQRNDPPFLLAIQKKNVDAPHIR